MKPTDSQRAAQQPRDLLVRTLPGSRRGTIRAHVARAERIGAAIFQKFHVGPYQAQIKHLRWYLETQTKHLTTSTRYRHWLTVRAIASALGKLNDWKKRLQGPWIRPEGKPGRLQPGRPAKLPHSTPTGDR